MPKYEVPPAYPLQDEAVDREQAGDPEQVHVQTGDPQENGLESLVSHQACLAMTINKARDQTLQQVGLYLPKPTFGHGHLYVALSRCTTPENLKILIENGNITGREDVYP
jgi:hypothetical protein